MDTSEMEKFAQTAMEDIIGNPHKYGAHTLEEFMRNPERWRNPRSRILAVADAGSKQLGKVIQKHVYYVNEIKCNNIEHAETMMGDLGLDPNKMQMKINLEDIGQHKAVAHIYFKEKSNLVLPEGM